MKTKIRQTSFSPRGNILGLILAAQLQRWSTDAVMIPADVLTTEYTELQPLLSGVHSVMRVKSVLAGEGVGCTPTPSHYIYPHQ